MIISHQGQKFGLASEGVLKQFSESDLCPCFKLISILLIYSILFLYHNIFFISYAFASVPVRADHTESSSVMCSVCLRKA